MSAAIGIDLGTTNCCMAVARNGKIVILENEEGKRTTPSVISFSNGHIAVGETAKKDSSRKAGNVIYDVKRLIGLKYADVEAIISQLPFKVIANDNRTMIMVEGRMYTPEELSAHLLKYLKDRAENRLNCTVEKAVVTVPTYFNDSQRQATIDASKIAGFKEVQLLNEPTAAAIHYGIENKITDGRVILVFDFGGGTFDVSIIKFNNNLYEVLAVDGDVHLGGADVDNKIVQYIMEKYKINLDERKPSVRNLARIKAIAESIKTDLSANPNATADIIGIDGVDEDDFTMTRTHFEQLTRSVINKTIDIVENCLRKTENLDIVIDDVLLVGGSCRIKIVDELLQNKFSKKSKQNVNPDEAVAAGAAIYAARLYDGQFPDLKLINITPFALGVEVDGCRMSVIVQKYSKLPARCTKKYETVVENQKEIEVKVFSGDDERTANNNFLGSIEVSGIASGPIGQVVDETFEVDENGILSVSVVDHSGKSKHLQIKLDKGNLTQLELEQSTKHLNAEVKMSKDIRQFREYQNQLESKTGEKFQKEYSEKNMTLIKSKLKS